MTTATAEPEAVPLTEELQRKIVNLSDECVRLMHEFEIKNDEARALHKDWKEKVKRLLELISSSRVALPLFDRPGVNGHAQVGAEAAAEEEAFDAADNTPADAVAFATELEAILTAAGVSEAVVATLRSFNLNTVEQLEHYCQESVYEDPIAKLDGIGKRKSQQIMKAIGEHKRQAEATAAEVLTSTSESTQMPAADETSTGGKCQACGCEDCHVHESADGATWVNAEHTKCSRCFTASGKRRRGRPRKAQ